MRLTIIVLAAALAISSVALAQASSVRDFLIRADRIPQGPAALFHPETRRLMADVENGLKSVEEEQARLGQRGRARTICLPQRVPLSPQSVLDRFRAIPEQRRMISVTQALREWMAQRYPCG